MMMGLSMGNMLMLLVALFVGYYLAKRAGWL